MSEEQPEGKMELSDFLDQSELATGTGVVLQHRKQYDETKVDETLEGRYVGLKRRVHAFQTASKTVGIESNHEVEISYNESGTPVIKYGPHYYRLPS
jgi:hypothetical protein